MKLLHLLAILATFSLRPVIAQQGKIPTPSDKVQIQKTVTEDFIHPGIGLTKEVLENARTQVLAQKEPWYSGFQRLAADPNSSKTATSRNESRKHPGRPDVDAFNNRGIQDRLKQDAYKAKQQALLYFFTGDETYRANAMHIIRIWSQMDPKKYKAYSECYIHASYPVQDLIIAAEILRYTDTQDPKLAWTEKDTRDFTNNFVIPAVNTFLNGNGWFMNQNGYPLAAAMSGDIFRSDRDSYAKRVEWFTVNKTAPNKGWSSSITDLARLVDTNALTGEKATQPIVQLMEMGRDQAHAADDVEIFMNTSRQMNAQGTKVDPATGTISTAENAVGPYEFLNDRILAAANAFCQFMLGYDTPWVPAAYDIASTGEIRGVYPRIADNYRGRIRGIDIWDAYFYYAFRKGEDVARKAPYYHEAFTKRIVNSLTDWIFIPENATGEATTVAPNEQEPTIIEIERRSTVFDNKAVAAQEGNKEFVRVTPSEKGTRIAILSSDTDKKAIGMRIRTTGVTEVKMSGFKKPWLLPDTEGQWRDVTYTMGGLERFLNIVYMTIKGSPDTTVDLDCLFRNPGGELAAPAFRSGDENLEIVAYVGAPVKLDFAPAKMDGSVRVGSTDKPKDSTLNTQTGAFFWVPNQEGEQTFVVNLTAGETIAARKVYIIVTPDRESAIRKILSGYDRNTPYVSTSLKAFQSALSQLKGLGDSADNLAFFAKLMQVQAAVDALEPLTPLLPDGSMDYPKIVASSDIGESIGLLTDGNDDTFPIYSLAKDLNYIFDFGPKFQISVAAFALEGRLNFENRTQDTAFFGSNDGRSWTQLTEPLAKPPTELTRVEVKPGLSDKPFRYLKIEKLSRKSANLFEPSELRIYGRRHEVSSAK